MTSTPELLTATNRRPRLLYFNGPWHYVGNRILTSYVNPLQRILEQDFEVIPVIGNADFKAEVERHEPDAVLFHTGTESLREEEVELKNTDAYRHIPRMGFVLRDPISPSRVGPMNRLLSWGVDQIFANFPASDSPIPFFKNVIYVPWSIDPEMFRDYGEPKRIPISLTGEGWLSDKFFYRWRAPVMAKLVQRLPVYHVPVRPNHEDGNAYFGERYARLLNQSVFSAGCGSANHFLTRKLLEIPACRACLVTEETAVAKWAGFRDGVNCVFADASNVTEKLEALLDDRERLHAITDAGYEMVHSRHTHARRRAFAEWFVLWQNRNNGDRIVQVDPLQPLRRFAAEEAIPPSGHPDASPVVRDLKAGYAHLRAREWRPAIECFQRVHNAVPYLVEGKVGTAVCLLHLGQANAALNLLYSNTEAANTLRTTRWPDAINLAFMAVALIHLGAPEKAYEIIGRAAVLRHPALNSLRWHLCQSKPALRTRYRGFDVAQGDNRKNVETVHLFPAETFADWLVVWRELLCPKPASAALACATVS